MLTLADLLIKLRDRLLTAIEQEDVETCASLMVAFGEMIDSSYGEENGKLIDILDDLHYAAQHAGMRMYEIAAPAVPTAEQIKAVFQSDEE